MEKNLLFYVSYLCVILFVQHANAVPKYDTNTKSNNDDNKWGRSYYNTNNNTNEQDVASTKDRLQRLGYTTGYGALNGYPGSSTGLYNPIKLDLGGVVLGTLVGIGAIIIIPKLLHAFHGGYGGYARSDIDHEMSLTSIINQIDDILGQNNIDSTSCMQRAICTYVQSTEHNMINGRSDQFDQFIYSLSENSLVDYLLDGTAIKEAIENGKQSNNKSCDDIYSTCPLNNTNVLNILKKILPKKNDKDKLTGHQLSSNLTNF